MNSFSTDAGAHPLVSVCVPTVDRLSYLEEALTSIVSQTAPDWELVVGENSGEPAYGAEVDRLVARLTSELPNPVRVIHQATQLSMVGHANALVAAASGDYVLVLPDDDRLRPDCLELLTAPVRFDPSVDVIFSDHSIIRGDGGIDAVATESTTARYGRADLQPGRIGEADVIAVALRGSFTLQATLIRRQVLGPAPFREDAARLPDFDLFSRLARRRPPLHVEYSPERLVEYRVHNGQFSGRRGSADQGVEFHEQFLASLGPGAGLPPGLARFHRRKVAEHRAALAGRYAQSRQWGKWWHTSLAVIRGNPRWALGYMSLLRPVIPARLVEAARATRRTDGSRTSR